LKELPTSVPETSEAGALRDIPFNRFVPDELDKKYVLEALESGRIAGAGGFSQRCEELLAGITGAAAAVLTTSGTAALEMIALLLDVRPGDEVILPSFTFPSTANAFILRGARPVFIDIRPDTLNLDETLIRGLISSRTRVIMAMHYGGVACEMGAIKEVADRSGIIVVEDNATGLFGTYRGQMLGSIGELAALSHHETKNLSAGEGGTLLINDASFIRRAEVLREKGTDRASFVRGELERYTWVDLGSSYLMSEVLAGLLLAQIEKREAIQSRRQQVWLSYSRQLQDWARKNDVGLPVVPAHCEQPAHLFYLILPAETHRDAFVSHMKARGIGTASHYQPLHESLMGQRFGAAAGDCPVAADRSRRLVRLPVYPSLTGDEQERVIAAAQAFAA
jgi:dTDP-4-amino-4,6-dideoxygalactose transaminase